MYNGKNLRRCLALFITICMCVTSIATFNVFAVDETASENQVDGTTIESVENGSESSLGSTDDYPAIPKQDLEAMGLDEDEGAVSLAEETVIEPILQTNIRFQNDPKKAEEDNSTKSSTTLGPDASVVNADGDLIDIGGARGINVLTFDIAEFNNMSVSSATLNIIGKNSNREELYAACVDDSDSNSMLYNYAKGAGAGKPNNMSWSTFTANAYKDILNYFATDSVALTTNISTPFDLTAGIQSMQARGIDKLTVVIYAAPDSFSSASEIYSVNATGDDREKAPKLTVTTDARTSDYQNAVSGAAEVDDAIYELSQSDATVNKMANRIDVKENITLPTTTTSGATVTWTSDNESISSTGTVTRPGFTSGDSFVLLTATITSGTSSVERSYKFKVYKLAPTDEQILGQIEKMIRERYGDMEAVRNFELPKKMTFAETEVSIVYSTDESSMVIDNDAVGDNAAISITRPVGEDIEAKVTATLNDGNATKKFEFIIYVMAQRTTYSTQVVADTYIRKSVPGENNNIVAIVTGMNTTVNEDNDVTNLNNARGVGVYRFDISEIYGTATSAQMSLALYSGNGRTVAFAYVDEEDDNNLMYNWVDTDTSKMMTWDKFVANASKPIQNYKILSIPIVTSTKNTPFTFDVTEAVQKAQMDGHKSITIISYEYVPSTDAASNIYSKETAAKFPEYIPTLEISSIEENKDSAYKEVRAAGFELDKYMASLNQNAYDKSTNPDGLDNRYLISTRIDRMGEAIYLPEELEDGTTIEWLSSDTKVIDTEIKDDKGVIINPKSYLDGSALFTLTAKLRRKTGERITKNYNVKVESLSATPDKILDEAEAAIKAKYENISHTVDFSFVDNIIAVGELIPMTDFRTSDSEHAEIGNTTGAVTVKRPDADGETAKVEITITLTFKEITRDITVMIYIPKITSNMTENIQDDLTKIVAQAKTVLGKEVNGIYYTNYYIEDENILTYGDITNSSVQNVPDANTIAYYEEGETALWGQLPKSEWDKFKAEIDESEALLNNPASTYAQLYNKSMDLIYHGQDLIMTAKLSDDEDEPLTKSLNAYQLRFSDERRQLNSIIYKAEAILLLEPYFHYKSNRETLQHEIDISKERMSYNYDSGYNLGRYQIAQREQNVKAAIKRFNMRETEGVVFGMNDGLYTTIDWYTSYHILADCYVSDNMQSKAENIIQSGSTATGGNSLVVGGGRAAALLRYSVKDYVKYFDNTMGDNDVVTDIKFGYYKYHSGGTNVVNYYIPSTVLEGNWTEEDVVYSKIEANEKTAPFTTQNRSKILQIDGVKELSWDLLPSGGTIVTPLRLVYDGYGSVKQALTEENNADANVNFMIGSDRTDYFLNFTNTASDIYSKRAGNANYPFLKVTTNYAPYEKLKVKYDFVMEKANKLLKKCASVDGTDALGNVCDSEQAGFYRRQDYDNLLLAISKAGDAIGNGDQNMVGMSLVAVLDAMRDLSNNQYKRTNIDPNSTLYFTAEEKEEIKQKIETVPELKAYYDSQISGISKKNLDLYQWGYALFMNTKITTSSGVSYDYSYGRDKAWYDDLAKYKAACGDKSTETFSTGRRAINSKPGPGVTYVSYEMALPSDMNEADANARIVEETAKYGQDTATPNWIGHIWMDDASLLNANGQQVLSFENSREYGDNNLGFENWETRNGKEMPVGWDFVDSNGTVSTEPTGTISKEQRATYKKSGSYSVYMANETSADNVGLRYFDPTRGDDSKSNVKNYMFPINTDSAGNAIPLTATQSLTVNSQVMQEGFLNDFNSKPIVASRGLTYKIRYYDKDGREIIGDSNQNCGSAHYFNFLYSANMRPSWGDAYYYMMTGDIISAQKVKYGLITGFADFCESVAMNEDTNIECNARGEVQAGRFLAIHMSMYSVIEDANVFTPEEKALFDKLVEKVVGYCMSARDNSIYDDSLYVNSNWYTDMYLGSACTALALREDDPDNHGKMKSSLFHANEMIDGAEWLAKASLDDSISVSGAYGESLRYMWAAYSRVASSAKFYSNTMNDNWFVNTKLPLVFEYGVQTQTAPYSYSSGFISSPTFGDTTISEGTKGMAMLAQYAPEVGKVNPTLSTQMIEAWKKAGKPVTCDGEGVPLTVFFLPLSTDNVKNIPVALTSTDYYHEASPIMYRKNPGRDNETLLVGVSSTKDLGHGHEDQGSFTMFKKGSFLVIDTSVENYWDTASKSIYLSSSNHAALTFYNSGAQPVREINLDDNTNNMANHMQTGQVANSTGISKLIADSFNDSVDKTVTDVEVQGGNGGGEHTRHLALLKNGLDSVVIWDEVRDNSAYTQFNLPVGSYSTKVDQESRKATSIGYYDYNVETSFLLPEDSSIVYDRMRVANAVPTIKGNEYPYQEILRSISINKGESQFNIVTPVKKGDTGITTQKIYTNDEDVFAYKVTSISNGVSNTIVCNSSTRAKSINLGNGLVNLETYENYNGNVPARTMLVLSSDEISKPDTVQITGAKSIRKPGSSTGGTLTYNYQSLLIDQYNNTMTGIHNSENNGLTNPAYDIELHEYDYPKGDYYDMYIKPGARPDYAPEDVVFNSRHPELVGYPKTNWSIADSPKGASIDPDTGVLTVTSDLKASSIVIVADNNGVKASYPVRVSGTEESAVTSVEVSGATRIGLTYGKDYKSQYSYTVYDQFGNKMDDIKDIQLTVKSTIDGITIDSDGIITVSANATNKILGNDQTGGSSFSVVAQSRSNSYVKNSLGVYADLVKPTYIKTNIGELIQVQKDSDEMIPIDITVTDQNGTQISNDHVSNINCELFGINGTDGISVINKNGNWYLFVPGNAEISEENVIGIRTTANVGEDMLTTENQISLTTDQIATSIEITGEDEIIAGKANAIETYTAIVRDRFGTIMNVNVDWFANKVVSNTTFNIHNATYTVTPKAVSGITLITATYDDLSKTYVISVTSDNKVVIPDPPGGGGGGGGGGGTIGDGNNNTGDGSGDIIVPIPTGAPGPSDNLRFKDVPKDFWGYDCIEELAKNNIVKGAGDGYFYPDNTITRAEFVQMIVNLTKDEMPEEVIEFSDVSSSDWFYTAVTIGSAKGYITGYPEGDFKPDNLISRQDMALIISRVIKVNDINLSKGEEKTFVDEGGISDYAFDAVKEVQKYGIINGYDDGTFMPANNATRAEGAKMINSVYQGLQ